MANKNEEIPSKFWGNILKIAKTRHTVDYSKSIYSPYRYGGCVIRCILDYAKRALSEKKMRECIG